MSNNILLQCSSVKFFDDIWIGNILHVKIDEEKNRVYLNEPANDYGWIVKKLISVKPNSITFKNCETLKCESKSFNYYYIDRVIGTLKYYSKIRKNDKFLKMYEYKCKKNKRAF